MRGLGNQTELAILLAFLQCCLDVGTVLEHYSGMKRTAADSWPRTVRVGGTQVKVYRVTRADGSPGFKVADYSGGSRRLLSFPTAAAALSEAERIARLMASGESHAASVSGKDVASYGRAMELLRPTGVSIELAAANFAKAFQILGGDRIIEAAEFFRQNNTENLPPRTVAEVADEFIAQRESRQASARYVNDLRSRLSKLVAAFQCPIASVTSANVQEWLDGLKASPQTVKNHRTIAGTMFAFAERRGYIRKGANPVVATERVSVANGKGVEIYTPSQIASILSHAEPSILPCLAIAAFAGLRTAEIHRLEWKDVDLVNSHIVVAGEKAKTKSRRLVPISPNLKSWLAPYVQSEGRLWNLTHFPYHQLCRKAATSAGIAWLDNALRHSYASYRLAQVQSAAQVALEMGNSPQIVFRHYREICRPAAAAAWFAVAPQTPANVVALSQAVA